LPVRICVGCAFPGGPDAAITDNLEESEMLDYYELRDDGSLEHIAQTRKCLGGCADLVESIVRRGVRRLIVKGMFPGSLLRLKNAGVGVFLAAHPSVKESVKQLHEGTLKEISLHQFSKIGRKRKEGV